jgi:hypothetical protein
MADVVNRLFGGVVAQADDRVGRRRSGEMVTSDKNAGDWTADKARDKPSVAVAIPTSSALESPKRSVMIGAQAIVVPCPPMSDAEPTKAVMPFGSPSTATLLAAMRFWMTR